MVAFDWRERYVSPFEAVLASIIIFICFVISCILLFYYGIHQILIKKVLYEQPKLLQYSIFSCLLFGSLYNIATTINYYIWTFFPSIGENLTCTISLYSSILLFGGTRLSLYLFFLCRFYFAFQTTMFAIPQWAPKFILISMIITILIGFSWTAIGVIEDDCSDDSWFYNGLFGLAQDIFWVIFTFWIFYNRLSKVIKFQQKIFTSNNIDTSKNSFDGNDNMPVTSRTHSQPESPNMSDNESLNASPKMSPIHVPYDAPVMNSSQSQSQTTSFDLASKTSDNNNNKRAKSSGLKRVSTRTIQHTRIQKLAIKLSVLTFVSMVSSLLGFTSFLFVDSVFAATIDTCINLICVLLSFTKYRDYYHKICCLVHKFCEKQIKTDSHGNKDNKRDDSGNGSAISRQTTITANTMTVDANEVAMHGSGRVPL